MYMEAGKSLLPAMESRLFPLSAAKLPADSMNQKNTRKEIFSFRVP